MGILDSLKQATSNAAEYLTEEIKQVKKEKAKEKEMNAFRNTMRTYMKKGDISETDYNYLKETAAKHGIDTVDFKMRFDIVLSAKKEYDEQGKRKGLLSRKDTDPDLFFYNEDEIEEYFGRDFASNAGFSDFVKGEMIAEIKVMQKVEKELQRPHFDKAFQEAFSDVVIKNADQEPKNEQKSQLVSPTTSSQVQYTLNINGQNHGPYDMQQLQQMVQCGQLMRQTYIWKQGMANWEMAGNVQELAALFGAVPPPPPTMPPAQQ